jgi:3-oxoacyl-[acyl-carrier-protein] synthase-1
MAANDVIVAGAGMMTAVGLTVAETAASVRSATMRFGETSFLDKRFEPFTLAEVPEEALPPLVDSLESGDLTSRERRMLRLATQPLAECLASLPANEPAPPLFLALPEFETRRPLAPAAFLEWLQLQCGEVFQVATSAVAGRGRAGGLTAIAAAAVAIQSGRARFALAGGVDSHRDLYVLGTLDLEGRVKSGTNTDGFIPGEAAGFLLLTSRATAAACGLSATVVLSPVELGAEPGHLYGVAPYRGDGLAATIQQLVGAGSVSSPIREVYSSMNGESHWAKEWGVAFLRNRTNFEEGHDMHHPADCYGEVGAAVGPLLVGLAATGIREGYGRSPVLVYGSSDRGQRAALIARLA